MAKFDGWHSARTAHSNTGGIETTVAKRNDKSVSGITVYFVPRK